MADARRVERELLVLAWLGLGLRSALGLELRVPAVLRGADVPHPTPNPSPNPSPSPNPNPNQVKQHLSLTLAHVARGAWRPVFNVGGFQALLDVLAVGTDAVQQAAS